jgi:sterol desaturase/sphingolipid hydroxylase (fatty acid hydroxylase superfamily)
MLHLVFGSIATYLFFYHVKYKIRQQHNDNISFQTVIITTIANHIIGLFCIMYFKYAFNPILSFNPFLLITQLLSAYAFVDGYHYVIHRFFHTIFMYKYIHKYHHYLKNPYALGSIFCHPVEHMLFNMCIVFLPIILFKMHFVTGLVIVLIATYRNIVGHSGLTLLQTTYNHHYHHIFTNYNYGIGISDTIFGTKLKIDAY